MTEWTKVEDEMPKEDGKYLAIKKDNPKDVFIAVVKDGYFIMMDFPEVRYEKENNPYTHWMPLPEPPKEIINGCDMS